MTDYLIGITEKADPSCNDSWKPWVESGKPAILITKRPRLLLQYLHDNKSKVNVIVHCSITGLGGTDIEPNIEIYQDNLHYYDLMCGILGNNRVVLRIDPIIPEFLITYVYQQIVKRAKGRVRISFLDVYPHVFARFTRKGIKIPWSGFHAPISMRTQIWEDLGRPEVCAEPDLPVTACVSDIDCKILGVEPRLNYKGQRPLCHCLANKTEIITTPPKCSYKCLYCYWK